jgi:hypothetical protein
MRKAVAICAALILSVALFSCATVDEPPPETDGTTLQRYDGEPLRRRDIMARRNSAISLARALACIDRMLLEPWAENREAAIVIEDAGRLAPEDVREARNMWRLSEPLPRTLRRALFSELGFYADASPSRLFSGGINPKTLEDEVQRILNDHGKGGDKSLMLAAWRRFAPMVVTRRKNLLACRWEFQLGSAKVAVVESLLGPYRRAHLLETGRESLTGANISLDGYALPEGIAQLVAPGEISPVAPTIDALAATGRTPSFVRIEGATVHLSLSPDDREFLAAALKGMADGLCDLEYLPRGCTRIEATFDYLVGSAEARAAMTLARTQDGWNLERFVYEPAAAAVVGREGAALDLIEMLRKSEPTTAVSGK